MGLDMYLNATRHLKNRETQALTEIDGMCGMEAGTITCRAMYWRKANAIHQWFVANVQNEEDDCGLYEVSINQLKELIALCNRVLRERGAASELLPPCSGFFFGSAEIDERYWNDLANTADELNLLLLRDNIEDWDFTYQSSW